MVTPGDRSRAETLPERDEGATLPTLIDDRAQSSEHSCRRNVVWGSAEWPDPAHMLVHVIQFRRYAFE
jgi:hypothetical protein